MRWFTWILVLAVLLTGCAQPSQQQLPLPSFTVDASVQPPASSLPGFEDGEPRPLASVTNEDGTQAEFVANELWLATDDEAELEAFLARWQGNVLRAFDPQGLGGLARQYLVRINAAAADPATLGEDLRKLDPNATGDHKVSSQEGLKLLAAGASEAASGTNVGLNWVGSGGQFRDRTSLEAPSGSALAGVPYSQDAFAWPSHSSGANSAQNIGVAEAWRALDLAGKLNNRVKLAILDMGFQDDADWRGGWLAISNVPFVNPIGTKNLLWCGGGSDCPWHGTNAFSAAMAVPDNRYGSAGPAGPIANPIVVFTLYDFFTSITALSEARIAGARIANMSYGAPVPWTLAWSVLPFEAATAAFRATGMLLFAAAGNEGKDVDAESCTLGVCWERTWYTPCENAGVICVGGLAGNSKNKAGGSNYGNEQVDIFAPYTLWLGPDPDSPDNRVQVLNGTSFASPFAAGVAALIWAANPSLSAGSVETILMDTAHTSPDPKVRRYVNALAAVQRALGNVPPSITLHAQGGEVPLNVALTLSATIEDFEDPFPCCTVSWTSNVDGVLGSGHSVTRTFTTVGARTITVTATDSAGATSRASLVLNVVNHAPVATISRPLQGEEFFRDAPVILRGRASDRNEPQERLACERLSWTSSVAGDPFPVSGCEAEVTFASDGPRTLTLTATDPQGATGTASVTITIVEPPPNLPPSVQITSPEDGSSPNPFEPITLSGTATDPEGASPLTFEWTTQLEGDPPIVVGNAPSVEWTPSGTYDFSSEGTYVVKIRLSVTDPQGNTGTDFVTLEWLILR
jgi:serine protease